MRRKKEIQQMVCKMKEAYNTQILGERDFGCIAERSLGDTLKARPNH